MRIMHRFAVATGYLATAACASGQARAVEVGTAFVVATHDMAYLYTKDSHLSATTSIQLQYPSETGAVNCCLRLQGSALDVPSKSAAPVSDALYGNPIFRYRLKHLPAALKSNHLFIGAAVIGAQTVNPDAASAGTSLHVQVMASDSSSTVKICLGSEGSNLFLIVGGKLKSQLYYGFDYGVTATCDPKLFELPTAD
jgi:hypothetical protein